MHASPDPSPSPPSRTLTVALTRRSRDRQGDWVEPAGLDFGEYLKNPVVLWAHDLGRPPIGRVTRLLQSAEEVVADIEFADTPTGRELHRLYAEGFLRGWSLGFIPRRRTPLPANAMPPSPPPFRPRALMPAATSPSRESTENVPPPAVARKTWPGADETERMERGGYHISSAEVVEVSAVPVPAHPGALTLIPQTRPAKKTASRHPRPNVMLETGTHRRWSTRQLHDFGATLLDRMVRTAARAALDVALNQRIAIHSANRLP